MGFFHLYTYQIMKTAFITGASSGIGKATAEILATDHQLVICGRRTEQLESLAFELRKQTTVHILSFDVSNKAEVFSAVASLPKAFQKIDVLVNNAGNAHGLATFDDADLSDLEAMIDINVKGLIYVTKAILPLMIPHQSGHIINLSSIAGKQTYLNGTTYCASKAAVEALTKGMRLDLLKHNIKVTGVAPGAVETEFSLVRFKGDAEKSSNVYKGFDALQANDIAESIAYIVRQPAHVQIADITILPSAQADAVTIQRK